MRSVSVVFARVSEVYDRLGSILQLVVRAGVERPHHFLLCIYVLHISRQLLCVRFICSFFLSSACLYLSLTLYYVLQPSSRNHLPLSTHPRAGWGRFDAGWPGGARARGPLQDGGPRGQRTGVHPFGDEER